MYTIIFVAGLAAFSLLITIITAPIRRRNAEKLKSGDNAKEQIREIVNRLIPNGEELNVAKAISKEGSGGMIKDSLVDLVLSIILDGFVYIGKSNLPDEYIVAFGRSDLYFIPVDSDMKRKTIFPNVNQMSHCNLSTVSKVKYNSSKFKTIFKMSQKKGKFTFRITKSCFFTKSQEKERKDYDEFIQIFAERVNGYSL